MAEPIFARLVGIQHHQAQEVRERLVELVRLELRPEPDNEFDENAVGVFLDGRKLGFVEKAIAASISMPLQTGATYVAMVAYVDWTAKPYDQVGMTVAVQLPDEHD